MEGGKRCFNYVKNRPMYTQAKAATGWPITARFSVVLFPVENYSILHEKCLEKM
jgi:hypothetical protein